MSILVDSRPHAEAIKAALDATLGAWSAYDYDDVPGTNGNAGTLPNIYALLSVERRYNPSRRNAGGSGMAGWRVAVRGVGRTIDECRWALARVALALDEQRLTIDGRTTSPITFESDQAPELDEGRYSGLALYVYTH